MCRGSPNLGGIFFQGDLENKESQKRKKSHERIADNKGNNKCKGYCFDSLK
jgi:hypothetical protein